MCSSHCQKKRDLYYSTFLSTPLGILKKDIMNIGRLDSTESIKTNLPPIERSFSFQLLIFFFEIFPLLWSFFFLKFCNGSLECLDMWREENQAYIQKAVQKPLHCHLLLQNKTPHSYGNWSWGLTTIQRHIYSFRFLAWPRSFSKNNIVSSAYWRINNPPSAKWGTSPWKWFFSLDLEIRIESMSPTMLERMGDKGTLCRKPFFVWKKCPKNPHLFWPLHSHPRQYFQTIRTIYVRNLSFLVLVVETYTSPYHKPFGNQFT